MPATRKGLKQLARFVTKAFLRKILGEYACYRVFAHDLDLHDINVKLEAPYRFADLKESDILEADDEFIRARAWYAGSDARGFGVYRGKKLVCIQWFWYGDRYRTRNFLAPRER